MKQHLWLTFDDVLVLPAESRIVPRDVNLKTNLTKNISLNVPLVSADMDTVTGWKMAREIAKQGGLGFLWKHPSADQQAEWVDKVKFTLNAKISKPVTVGPDSTLEDINTIFEKYDNRFSSLIVFNEDKRVVGLVTKNSTRFAKPGQKVMDFMIKNPIVSDQEFDVKGAYNFMKEYRIGKLILVDREGKLEGLYCFNDVCSIMEERSLYNRDKRGQLRVGANVGVRTETNALKFDERVEKLLKKSCDVLLVGTAHGHSENVINTVKYLKEKFSIYDFDIIAGNVVTYEGAKALFEVGADAVKVGIGPGSICTTRVVAGAGAPQITAIYEAARAGAEYFPPRPVIADGGIRYSGDITKAIAAGASCVMLGSIFARAEEAPGEVVMSKGQRFKEYRGMGSIGAMKDFDTGDRYGKISPKEKSVPEGIEGRVPIIGSVADVVYQLMGGLRSGMGYAGALNIGELQKSKLIRVSNAALRESHPHDIAITGEAPNYPVGGEK